MGAVSIHDLSVDSSFSPRLGRAQRNVSNRFPDSAVRAQDLEVAVSALRVWVSRSGGALRDMGRGLLFATIRARHIANWVRAMDWGPVTLSPEVIREHGTTRGVYQIEVPSQHAQVLVTVKGVPATYGRAGDDFTRARGFRGLLFWPLLGWGSCIWGTPPTVHGAVHAEPATKGAELEGILCADAREADGDMPGCRC
eukprot:PhM_4_TR16458/c2_g3_i1/m.14451